MPHVKKCEACNVRLEFVKDFTEPWSGDFPWQEWICQGCGDTFVIEKLDWPEWFYRTHQEQAEYNYAMGNRRPKRASTGGPGLRVVLHVPHQGRADQEPVNKMVGKIFPIDGVSTFFHETRRGSISQWHHKLSSPGGIDVSVVEFLLRHKVKQIIHFDEGTEKAYITTPKVLNEFGIVQRSGNRYRLYLSVGAFDEVKIGPLWFKAPYITDIKVLPTVPRTIDVIEEKTHRGAAPKPSRKKKRVSDDQESLSL